MTRLGIRAACGLLGLLAACGGLRGADREEPAAREFTISGRYLNLPVKNGAAKRRVRYEIDGAAVREFEIELADDAPSFWVFSDVSAFRNKRLRVVVDALPASSKALDAITAGDEIKGADAPYQEKGRPQFHFTSRRGWLNDPNGLVYYKGEYHLFYQHNPFGWEWGNMHWGHAVSKDLVHWKELPEALYPRQFGDWCFSGSAVVDAADTSGFKTGAEPALVAAYTSTGRGECIAFSNDRGRTWTDFKDDPVVKHAGRDPRLLWHGPSKQWVMAVYDETDGKHGIAFYTSPDLKKWDYRSRVEGFFECPDLFELAVDGDDARRQWVLYSGDARYVLGDFDGKTFTAKTEKLQLWHGNFYAAQTYSNAPDGRRIQIGWAQGVTFPGMPFNQQMSVPCNLTLRTTADGVRLFAQPVPEIESLHDKKHTWEARALGADATLEVGVAGELLDVRAEFEVGKAETIGLTVRGVPVVYDAKKQELSCNQKTAPLKPLDGKIRLRLLVDRGSVEVFGNDGRVALSVGVKPAEAKSILVQSRGGEARLISLEAVELKSAWVEP